VFNLENLKAEKTIVKISQPNSFKGSKLGLYIGECKYKDGGLKVYLFDKTMPYRDICVQLERGDTLEIVGKSK